MYNKKIKKCSPLPLATKREAPGCDDKAGWLWRRGKLAATRREAGIGEGGWLQRLQSVAANEVLLVAASGKGRSRRSAA